MYHKKNTLLSLDWQEIKIFFLRNENYINFPLPPYFNFSELLNKISVELLSKKLSSIGGKNAKTYENLNYKIFGNKDGKFAWRPYQIINPVIYSDLVNCISEFRNWKMIKKRFGYLRGKSLVTCVSLPVINDDLLNLRKDQILNWWEEIEQQSIVLSLHYSYIHQTDISDCYSSIYTHSIPWAFHDKEYIKNKGRHDDKLIGNKIDVYLQQMSYGQTNGIPQGSTLMDFIAEIVLLYADYLLTIKIKELGIKDFQILRYRDDYRIFTNNSNDGDEILKQLSYILSDLGLKLNSSKTRFSRNIIKEAIKPDKYSDITMFRGHKNVSHTLLSIFELAEKYPNSGSIEKHLHKFFQKIQDWVFIPQSQNYNVLIAIIVDIIIKNPRVYPIGMGIISKLLSLASGNERNNIINIIRKKFSQIPNTGFLNIWTQRVTIKLDENIKYEEKMCQKVYDPSIQLWNIDWLTDKSIKKLLNETEIVNQSIIDALDVTIKEEEINYFIY